MKIGILKETKNHEGRVALIPSQVEDLVKKGHTIFVQTRAGLISGFTDADYRKVGAKIISGTRELIKKSEMVIKVKEPTHAEIDFMIPGQLLFCYLHLAPIPQTLKKILKKQIIALGYETLEMPDHSLPLLKPMSEIAGKLATQSGSHFLRADCGGRGVLLGGTEKAPPANVFILGAGIVGENAAKIAVGMGARTTIVDISPTKLAEVVDRLNSHLLKTDLSSASSIEHYALEADLLIGGVLIPGAKAPTLVSKKIVSRMKKGSVIVDVAVDQGGCVETCMVTSHSKPVVNRLGVLHYGVPNMPAAVPMTSTFALTKETFPYISLIADMGLDEAIKLKPELKSAINCSWGEIVYKALL